MHNSDYPRATKKMRQMFLRMALFFIPILICWVGLECWGLRIPNSHSVKIARLDALSPSVDTIILGSSSAYWGICATQLSGCAFNLANVSQTPYYDFGIIEAVLPKLTNLKMVIIPIGYNTLFIKLHETKENWRQYYYQQEWHIPPVRQFDRLDLRMCSRVALLTPQLVFRSFLSALWTFGQQDRLIPLLTDTDMDDHGWWRPNRSEEDPIDLDDSGRIAINRHHQYMLQRNEIDNLDCLKKTITALRERHVEVFLVTLPVWGSYEREMNPVLWSRTMSAVDQLDLIPGVHYFSFLNTPSLNPKDFYDADHLSVQGAIAFTHLLNSKIISHQ